MFPGIRIPLDQLLELSHRQQRYYRIQSRYVNRDNELIHVLYPRCWLMAVNERAGTLHIYNCNGHQVLDLATVYWIEVLHG